MQRHFARRDTAWVFNFAAELYAWFTGQHVWRESCTQLARELPEGPITILDLGCGYGVSTEAIGRERPRAVVIGSDRAPRMLSLASRGGAAVTGAAGMSWTLADAGALPFRSESIDAVTMHSVLYLLPEPERALSEIHRVLTPGGILVTMEPNAERIRPRHVTAQSHDPRFWLSAALWRVMSGMHGRFDGPSLCAMLALARFTQVRARRTLGGLGVLARAVKPA